MPKVKDLRRLSKLKHSELIINIGKSLKLIRERFLKLNKHFKIISKRKLIMRGKKINKCIFNKLKNFWFINYNEIQ